MTVAEKVTAEIGEKKKQISRLNIDILKTQMDTVCTLLK